MRQITATQSTLLRCVVLVALISSSAAPAALGEDAKPSISVELALKQGQLADRYRQLETLLLKMAEYDAGNNPRRAALLRQALSKGKERQIGGQMDELVKVFQREQLQKAVEGQTGVQSDLKALLDLLLSENRPDRLKNEQTRVRNYIKQLDRIIRQQKSVQGRTEGGENVERLAKDQQRIENQTNKLGKEIDEAEALNSTDGKEADGKEADGKEGDGKEADGKEADGKEADGKEADGKEGDGKEGDGKEADGKEADGKEADGKEADGKEGDGKEADGKEADGKEGDGKEGDGKEADGKEADGKEADGKEADGEEADGKEGDGKQGDGGSGSGQQPQDDQQFPGRKRIEAAEDRMRRAQDQLNKAEREEAVTQQEEAKRLLQQARAELEEILRQLREEEIERVLAMLEGRFRKMLEMELKVQDTTVRLNKTPAAKRTRQFTVQSGKLSLDQRKIILEVDKALTLLREEGSSVAFPEATQQMREDMLIVSRRLAEEKVGSLTQAVEADIVSALEEMITALQKAQKEAEERRQQQQQGRPQQADPSNQPLVNQIAELKMIRALQMRINTRTQRFSKTLVDVEDPVGQATDDDLLESLRGLSERQKRIHKVTSDIVLGKNK